MFDGPKPHVGGPVIKGLPTVLTGSLPQARVSDTCVCVGPPDIIVKGSAGVLVGGLPAARLTDMTAHGGMITTGMPTVLIGEIAGGGSAPGSGSMVGAASGAAAITSPGKQAAALIGAHRQGSYFCRRC
jgi:uncharacterized Zn-binding protein involved in type VI secretion